MKVAVAGPRDFTPPPEEIERALSRFINCSLEIGTGGAPGVDKAVEEWAMARGIPVSVFPADWATYGNDAGPIRNYHMARWMHVLQVIRPFGVLTSGTCNMVNKSAIVGKTYYTHEVGKPAHLGP